MHNRSSPRISLNRILLKNTYSLLTQGLTSNWSIAKRFGFTDVEKLKDLPDDDPVWPKIGHYLAVCCANLGYVLSPEVIVLAGGVMKRKILYDIIRSELPKLFNGYQVLYKKTGNLELFH